MARKVLLWILVLLLVLLIVPLLAGWLYLRTSLPRTSGTVQAAGLDAALEIVRDADGVPHIYAATDHDAFFGLGYVHAQDRLWQLEMNRRIGSGRLAEILGEDALEIDQWQRIMGYRRVAEANLPGLAAAARAALEAYAAGYNAWLAEGHTLPPEFLILGVKPEPWTPLDSLVWAKMMAWDLGGDFELEQLRAQVIAALGPERAAQLLPAYPADGVNVLQETGGDASAQPSLLAVDKLFEAQLGLGGKGKGSNDWVIHGSRTETGLPLLADDPHLGASIPSVWYLAEVQGDTLHAAGATFPGLPAVVIGHNERIAWGVTNVNPDVQDLFAERINPDNPNQVEHNGAWEDMTIIEEEIRVSGRDEPLKWAARSTRHGPLISDAQEGTTAYSLRWTALDADDTTIDAFLGINYAANWEEFREAMRAYVAPSQNFVYADTDGNIGYFVPGRIPIRKQGDGMLPAPGWNDASGWAGFIPFEELPQALNPGAGYVATANNRVVGDDYPYMISNDWSEPYRAERIVEMIEQMTGGGETMSVDDMAAMQADQTSTQVRQLLPFFQSLAAQDDRQQEALGYLKEWDGVLRMDSVAASLYEAWMVHFERAIFADDLRGDLYDAFADSWNSLFVADVLGNPELGRAWCDDVHTAGAESCEETARAALDTALDDLAGRMGKNMGGWQWEKVHRTQYPHRPFSQVSALRRFFHRSIANGGDRYTVNVAPANTGDLYNQTHVPSYRQIVDLADFNRSLYMTTTGQSGNPLSPHYADFIERHRDVEYMPMRFGRDNVAGDVLRLEPGS